MHTDIIHSMSLESYVASIDDPCTKLKSRCCIQVLYVIVKYPNAFDYNFRKSREMYFVTKITPISNVDGTCCTNQKAV